MAIKTIYLKWNTKDEVNVLHSFQYPNQGWKVGVNPPPKKKKQSHEVGAQADILEKHTASIFSPQNWVVSSSEILAYIKNTWRNSPEDQ